MSEAVAQFRAELQRLGLELAQATLRRELAARLADDKPARRGKRKAAPPPPPPAKRKKGAGKRKRTAQLELPVVRAPRGARKAARQAEEQPSPKAEPEVMREETSPVPAAAQGPQPGDGKRKKWTRESVIEELASWMIGKAVLDASYVTRHGPPGLAAAARRIFGRFDAALNVASLHFAKMYPEGRPNQKQSQNQSQSQK